MCTPTTALFAVMTAVLAVCRPNVCVTETVVTVSASDYVVERSCRSWRRIRFCG